VREADNLPLYSADVKKSMSLNSPRPLWACMACNGCALPFLPLQPRTCEINISITPKKLSSMCVILMSVLLPAGAKYLQDGVNSTEMTVRLFVLYLSLRSTCEGIFSALYGANAPARVCVCVCEAVLVADSHWQQ
jgi:hypothetical protein